MKTILIYSGGLDSTTLLYKLLKNGDEVRCISFDYGQRHKKELQYARRVCTRLNVPHTVLDVTSAAELMTGSALTSKNIPVPEGNYQDKTMRSTVVPSRNMIFISIAVAYAVSVGASRVAIGVHAGDHAIYPDCRPVFIKAMRAAARIANYQKIELLAPFLFKTKRDIAQLGKRLGVPFELTWTCYKGLVRACGKCGACVERHEALL